MLKLEHDFFVRVHYLMARMSHVNFFERFGLEANGEDGKSEFLRQIELVHSEFCFLECLHDRVYRKMTREKKLQLLIVAWYALRGLYEKFRKEYGLDKMNLEFNLSEYCRKFNLEQYPDGPFYYENEKSPKEDKEDSCSDRGECDANPGKRKLEEKRPARKKRFRKYNVSLWKRRWPVSNRAPTCKEEEDHVGGGGNREEEEEESDEREGPRAATGASQPGTEVADGMGL